MNEHMPELVQTAWSIRELKGYTIARTCEAVASAYELDDESARLVQMSLIELAVGISAIWPKEPREPSISEALDYYKTAIKSKAKTDLGIAGEECDARLAEEVMRQYIINLTKY